MPKAKSAEKYAITAAESRLHMATADAGGEHPFLVFLCHIAQTIPQSRRPSCELARSEAHCNRVPGALAWVYSNVPLGVDGGELDAAIRLGDFRL
jgi:hypothetical protein